MSVFTYTIPEQQVRNIHKVVESRCYALKNWIASKVEAGDLTGAQELVSELREFQALFAATNLSSRYEITEVTGRPIVREITVELARS